MKATKAEIIAGLHQTRKEIIETCACLPSARQEQPFLGEWSLKDLLAHFIGWDNANLQALDALRQARLPEFYILIDKDWRRFNSHWVEAYRPQTFAAALDDAVRSQRLLLDRLAAMPEAEFRQDFGVRYKGYKVTVAGLLEADLKETRLHLQQVLAWLSPAERAESLFLGGYNCAQSVLQAFAPRWHLEQTVAARLGSPWGAGIAYQGRQCGAVSGALMALGIEYGQSSAADATAKALAYEKAQEFIARFKAACQTDQCRELLCYDLSQPEALQQAWAAGVFERQCPLFVRQAAQILDELFAEGGPRA